MDKLHLLPKRILFLTIALWFLVPVLFNFLVVQLNENLLYKLLHNSEEQFIFQNFQKTYKTYILILTIISFLIPSLIAFWYFLPPHLYLLNLSKNSKLCLEKIVNAPLFDSLVSIIGWLIGAINIVFLHIKYPYLDMQWVLKQSLFTLFEIIFCFSFVYYTLEIYNRKFLFPKIFSENEILKVKTIYPLNISQKLIIYYLSIFGMPAVLLTVIVLNLINKQETSLLKNFLYIILLFAIVTIILTYYLKEYFLQPIQSLHKTTRNIIQEELKDKNLVTTSDELGVLTSSINEMIVSLEEKEKIKDTFGKVVDPKIRDLLLQNKIYLGGQIQEVTIMFTDIRGFTKISESLEPEKVVFWLNKYFQKMEECIVNNKGIINKFIGDAILVIFGAPIPDKNHPSQAVQTALDMRKASIELNRELQNLNLPEIRIGIGIHTGEALVGNVGSYTRCEYTVIGDTVNIASRVENLCKKFNVDLLFTEETQRRLTGYKTKKLGESQIRGRQGKVSLYTL